MAENKEQSKNIASKLKKLLYNYDLTITYIMGEMKLRKANMNLHKGKNTKSSKRKFLENKIEYERYEIFLAEITNAKKETMENLNLILDKYQPRYRQVFIAYFLEDKQYPEIETITNYSPDAIKYIIRRLKNDLIDLYVL